MIIQHHQQQKQEKHCLKVLSLAAVLSLPNKAFPPGLCTYVSSPMINSKINITKTISIIEFDNVWICITTQLHTESPSPGILTVSCQNDSNLWNKLINSSFGRMKNFSAIGIKLGNQHFTGILPAFFS